MRTFKTVHKAAAAARGEPDRCVWRDHSPVHPLLSPVHRCCVSALRRLHLLTALPLSCLPRLAWLAELGDKSLVRGRRVLR